MTDLETRGAKLDSGWRDHDGFVGPMQPGTGPRSDPSGEFPTGPEVGQQMPNVQCATADDRALGSVEEVGVSVWLDGPSLTPTVQKELVAQFRVPAGRHVYASPAPAGSIAVDLILDDNERLVQRPIFRPPAEPHKLAGTDETFDVHHNVFALRLPLTVNNASEPEITITGELVWQSCDNQVCDIPVRKRFEMTLPVTASPPVALGSKRGAELAPNAMAHFVKTSERRKKG